MELSLVERPTAASDLTRRRGLWDSTWAGVERRLPLKVPARRMIDVARTLFSRLGEALPATPPEVTRVRGELGPQGNTLVLCDGARRVRVAERWRDDGLDPDDASCDAEVTGLPGGALLVLEGGGGFDLERYSLHAPRGALGRLADVWADALTEHAAPAARWTDEAPVPSAWLERARALPVAPGDPERFDLLELGAWQRRHSELRLVVGPVDDGVRWSVAVAGSLDREPVSSHPTVFLEPVGPLPRELSRRRLHAAGRPWPAEAARVALLGAVTGGAGETPTSTDEGPGRLRVGDWLALTRPSAGGRTPLRVQHERGAGPALFAWLAPTGILMDLVGPASAAEAAARALRERLEARGWRITSER